MKKIIYIALTHAYGEKSKFGGVGIKVNGQCKGLVENGWDVHLLTYGDDSIVLININTYQVVKVYKTNASTRRMKLLRICKYLVREMKFDAVYIRYPFADLQFILTLKNVKKHVSLIFIEIATYPIERWGINYGLKKFLISRIDMFFGLFLKKYVHQFRIIGSNADKVYGVPAINISNCIDSSSIPVKTTNKKTDAFTIITVSTMNDYHGYDRLIIGLNEYYKKHTNSFKVKIIMVGKGPMEEGWKSLLKDFGLENDIEFVGIKTQEELTQYFNIADIAVGSLGLHRVGLYDISTLKCKEYCARGIPFVCSNNELGFDQDFPFIMHVDANESPIDVKELLDSYVKIIDEYPNYSKLMRDYAEENLNWKNQMKLNMGVSK